MIPFSPPYITEDAINEVIDTLRSGWITTGPKTKLFEKQLAEYCGNSKTLCVNSATFGLELVLRWFGVGQGDEVIVPAYTYTATASVVLHVGAKPVMVDVNADDFNINLIALKNAITDRTKVIIPVDIAGFPVDIDDIVKIVNSLEIRQKFNPKNENQQKLGRILLMSDAAHSLGAVLKGKKIGSQADITVFSFHAVKNLTTAEGGAIALNLNKNFDNEQVYNELNILSLHGQTKDALAKTVKGQWRYDIVEPAYKGNMTDLQASLGIAALRIYETEILPRRRKIFEMYTDFFKKYQWAQLPIFETASKTSSFHVYALRINGISEQQRDDIIKEIFNRDVAVNVHFQPLPLLSAYKKLGYDIADYPISYDNYSREISLPVYVTLTDEQVTTVCNAVKEAVETIINRK